MCFIQTVFFPKCFPSKVTEVTDSEARGTEGQMFVHV